MSNIINKVKDSLLGHDTPSNTSNDPNRNTGTTNNPTTTGTTYKQANTGVGSTTTDPVLGTQRTAGPHKFDVANKVDRKSCTFLLHKLTVTGC